MVYSIENSKYLILHEAYPLKTHHINEVSIFSYFGKMTSSSKTSKVQDWSGGKADNGEFKKRLQYELCLSFQSFFRASSCRQFAVTNRRPSTFNTALHDYTNITTRQSEG